MLRHLLPLCLLLGAPHFARPAPEEAHAPEKQHTPGRGEAPAASARVGRLELSGPITEAPPLYAWEPAQRDTSLGAVIERIDHVVRDEAYAGLVVDLDQPRIGLAQVEEIGAALDRLRATGRPVLCFAERYTLSSYLIACHADRILLQRGGGLELTGLGFEEFYLAGLLEKLGIEADFVQVGRFKGAAEPLTERAPSEAWNRNIGALLDNLYAQVLGRIAAARRMDEEAVEAAMAQTFGAGAEAAVASGLVDAQVDRDLQEATEPHFGPDLSWDRNLGTGSEAETRNLSPFQLLSALMRPQRPALSRAAIAEIHVLGPITSGQSEIDTFAGTRTTGSRTLTRALEEATAEPLVRGILLRIDSPGGSALASDLLWQAVRAAASKKPVYVSIGASAASGGYYIASAGTRLYAPETAIVGSIGVVGGKMVLGELYTSIGLGVHHRARGPLAGLDRSTAPFTPAERKKIRASMEEVYGQFLERIETARGAAIDDLEAAAAGRIFTGRQARARGLVDAAGGRFEARAALAEAVGLEKNAYERITLPPPLTLPDLLEHLFGGAAARPLVTAPRRATPLRAAEPLIGPEAAARVRELLTGLGLLRKESVLTLWPRAVRIR